LPEKEVKMLGFNVSRKSAEQLALAMYEGEPCRVCGEIITDASKCVYAGYSLGNKARSAHKVCWDKNLDKSQWAYPTDDAS
jgi:hypothetical protein